MVMKQEHAVTTGTVTPGLDWQTYKLEHEAFMSNLVGSSVAAVVACLAHGPALLFVLKVVQQQRPPWLLRDFLLLAVPMLLNMTVLYDYCHITISVLAAIIACVLAHSAYNHSLLSLGDLKSSTIDAESESENVEPSDSQIDNVSRLEVTSDSKKAYLTYFRGIIVLKTCLAILAVDFQVFPRSLAKTETFGVSLMDVGVGAYIVSSAVTSSAARLSSHSHSNSNQKMARKTLITRIIVLLLGIGRLVTVKLLNYHEHTSEYGLHWNFFVTLACVWVGADMVRMVIPRYLVVPAAIIMLAVHQWMLLRVTGTSNSTVSEYILSSQRDPKSFLSSNREGICSLMGLLPVYLLTEEFSSRVFFARCDSASIRPPATAGSPQTQSPSQQIQSQPHVSHLQTQSHTQQVSQSHTNTQTVSRQLSRSINNSNSVNDTKRVVASLFTACVTWAAVWAASSHLLQPTSRRLANLPFAAAILSFAAGQLLLVVLSDALSDIVLSKNSPYHRDSSSMSGSTSHGHGRAARTTDVPMQFCTTPFCDTGVNSVRSIPAMAHVRSLEGCSDHQLVIFMASNLLTGLVNTSLQTLRCDSHEAMAVLTVYTLAVLSIAWACGDLNKPAKAQ